MPGIINNVLSERLLQDEIIELSKRLKLTEHQLDQVKEEISIREASLLKEKMETARINKEKEMLRVIFINLTVLSIIHARQI